MRSTRFVVGFLVAGLTVGTTLVTTPGCGSGFLGLEDYQRDILFGGLAVAILSQQDDAADDTIGTPVDGRDGVGGLTCWDLNGDGVKDPDEDVNGDGEFDVSDCIGGDGADGANGVDGADGEDGLDGTSGAAGDDGERGPQGPAGPEFFDVWVDDFFSYEDPKSDNVAPPESDPRMPVGVISIDEPVLRSAEGSPIAYRVGIPGSYERGNDVTMRLFLYRTGPTESVCSVFTLDSRRLRDGSDIEIYGDTCDGAAAGRVCGRRWIHLEPDISAGGDGLGDPGTMLVVDLPLNSASGLNLERDLADEDKLSGGDFLAFEINKSSLSTDSRAYQLLGVEFFESATGDAELSGDRVYVTDDVDPCAFSDCNENGLADDVDIASGESSDCNSNGVPDECDIADETSQDCNTNEVPDECDISDETSPDCNTNEIPDECDLVDQSSADCNTNEIPDECDIADGTSEDCQGNGIPDECDEGCDFDDCNSNGIPDDLDISQLTSADCNLNSVPDDCDLADGTSQDCNSNTILDECDIVDNYSEDCNTNDVPDECDIDDGTSEDCQSNGIPDECDGGCGFVDCNSNETPDDIDIETGASKDCNENSVPDECDIDEGTSADCQPNGIPDECDLATAESGTVAGQGEGRGKIYWTDYLNNKIQQVELDGVNFRELVTTGLEQAAGIALDVDGGKMYWAEQTGTIKRADLDGGNVEDIVTSVVRPIGIAVDAAGGKVYWTESANPTRKIQRANLDGSNVEDLINTTSLGMDLPWGITLDVPNGKLYWTDTAGFIMRADLDGGNVERLLRRANSSDFWPTGIAVDSAGGKIYWTEDYYNKIQSANLEIPAGEADWNRTDIETLVSNVNLPGEIALDVAVGKMYWVDYYSGTIKRANMDGSTVETVINVGRSILIGLALELPPVLMQDCNRNGVPDSCEIRDGAGEDCNQDGVLDVCNIADGTSEDCQSNNIPDMCDIRDGTSVDDDENGVPDECASAQLLGPIPYLMVRHSPFGYTGLGPNFFWERFETGALTTPGVTVSSPGFVRPPGTRTDSVDADDGVIDGRGTGGYSFWVTSSTPGASVTFTFDEVALGFFPQQAGIVWTDGTGTITFEAFDASGASLGTVTGNHAGAGEGGETDEDRFYGVTNSGGISAITISNGGLQMEVDHLMYGIATTAE